MAQRQASPAGMARSRRGRGFTLLELVVVLAIMALVVAFAAVRLRTFVEAWRANASRDTIFGEVQHLPVLARVAGRRLRIASLPAAAASAPDSASKLDWPEGWTAHFDPPLTINPNGACADSTLLLSDGSHHYLARVAAPFCTVTLDAGGKRPGA